MTWQHRVMWPLPVLLAAGLLLCVDAVAGGKLVGNPIGLLVLSGAAVAAGLKSRAVPLLLVGAVSVVAVVLADGIAAAGRFSAANDAVFYGVVVFAPAAVGWLFGERTRRVSQLRRQTAELERRRASAGRAARAAEVERVERHVDGALAQRLAAIIDGIRRASAVAASDVGDVPARLYEVEGTARSALEELRDVLGTIRTISASQAAPSVPPTPTPTHLTRWPDLPLSLAGLPLAFETGPSWPNVLLALVQGPALCLARRRPIAGTVPLVALAGLQTAYFAPLPPTVSWLVPGLLLTYLSSLRLRRNLVPVGLLVLVVEFAAITAATPAPDRSLGGMLPSGLLAGIVFGAGRLVRGAELRAAQLQATLQELERTQDESARVAAADQRAEIARELHDVGAHNLTVVCLQAGAVQALWNRDRAQARVALDAMLALADAALTHLRASLTSLAAQPADQPLEPAALEVLASVGRAVGLEVDLETTGLVVPIAGGLALAAYRVVQESLTNAARHAPGARVTISLDYRGEVLDLRVRDSGGCSPATRPHLPGTGQGLQGMRDRVYAVHGSLEAGADGAGFTVHAQFPLARPSETPTADQLVSLGRPSVA